MKKVADSLHLDNSPQFGEEWYQFLCEVCNAKLFQFLFYVNVQLVTYFGLKQMYASVMIRLCITLYAKARFCFPLW